MPEMTSSEASFLAAYVQKIQQLEAEIADWRTDRDQLRQAVEERNQTIRLNEQRIERLEGELALRMQQIKEHNQCAESDCNYRRTEKLCEAYTSRGRICPDCPRQWTIDHIEYSI